MSGSKISDFFSPTTSRSNKRSRSSPPDSGGTPERKPRHCAMDHEKVGEMTLGQLMLSLNKLWDDKLKVLATKEELNSLESKVDELKELNKEQSEEINNLKIQNRTVLAKVNDLESRSRRNNLIFKGLKWQGNKVDCKEVVQRFLADVLGYKKAAWVNRAHFIGEGDNKAIIAHFPDDADIDYIMQQTRNLRGTGYVIHRDYTKEVRTKRGYLMAVRAELERVTGRRHIPLRFDHLLVNNLRLTWEDGKLMAGREDGQVALKRLLDIDMSSFLLNLATNGPPRHHVQDGEDRQRPGPEMANTTATSHQGRNTTARTFASVAESKTAA